MQPFLLSFLGFAATLPTFHGPTSSAWHVTIIHLGKPPPHPWLAVCQSFPASVMQAQNRKHVSLFHVLVDLFMN
jgi:hypothetical protein